MNQEGRKKDGEREESLAHRAGQLKIPYFCGVFNLETLPSSPQQIECGNVNLNLSVPNRWVCYWKNGNERVFFDPLAQVTPGKMQNYLKTRDEFDNGLSVIQRNINRFPAGHIDNLLLHVLEMLTGGLPFQKVIDSIKNGNDSYHEPIPKEWRKALVGKFDLRDWQCVYLFVNSKLYNIYWSILIKFKFTLYFLSQTFWKKPSNVLSETSGKIYMCEH